MTQFWSPRCLNAAVSADLVKTLSSHQALALLWALSFPSCFIQIAAYQEGSYLVRYSDKNILIIALPYMHLLSDVPIKPNSPFRTLASRALYWRIHRVLAYWILGPLLWKRNLWWKVWNCSSFQETAPTSANQNAWNETCLNLFCNSLNRPSSS